MRAMPCDGLAPDRLREAFGMFPSGLVAVAALIDGAPVGLTASSFVAVSLEPPMVAFCIQHSSTTWPRLSPASRIGVSVMGEDHDVVARSLAKRSQDRFSDIDFEVSDEGAVFIGGAAARFDTSIHDEVPAGDHSIVLLRINDLDIRTDVDPIIFHRSAFRALRTPER